MFVSFTIWLFCPYQSSIFSSSLSWLKNCWLIIAFSANCIYPINREPYIGWVSLVKVFKIWEIACDLSKPLLTMGIKIIHKTVWNIEDPYSPVSIFLLLTLWPNECHPKRFSRSIQTYHWVSSPSWHHSPFYITLWIW